MSYVRNTLSTDASDLEAQIGFLEDYEDFAWDVFVDIVDNEIRPNLLDELQFQPGKPQYPLRWASEKQRKFVMSKLRKENNLPYKRTGALVAAWVVKTERNGDMFLMVVENNAPPAAFVFGSLAQNAQAASRFQQPFHQDTGWPLATDTVRFWQDALIDEFNEALELETEAEFKRRAFTRTK